MSSFNELIVEALYRSELDRKPNSTELIDWTDFLVRHGPAAFAEQVHASPEAVGVRNKRAEDAKIKKKRPERTLEKLEADLAQADQYFVDLIGEIDVTPTAIAITAQAGASLPSAQIDRLRACSLVELVDASSRSPAMIRICDVADLDGSVAPETFVVALLGAPNLEWALTEFRYRFSISDLARRRLSNARVPVNMQGGAEIDLRAPTQRVGLLPCPALLLEARSADARAGRRWAARILADVTLHHFLSGQPARCMEVLDEWDIVMGSNLAGRYKAFAELLS